jgi:hypothetical protein
VETRPVVTLSEAYKTAIAKWRKTSQMDKVEIFILVVVVVMFLVLVLALITPEATGSGAESRDQGVLRVKPEQGLARLAGNCASGAERGWAPGRTNRRPPRAGSASRQRLKPSPQMNASPC